MIKRTALACFILFLSACNSKQKEDKIVDQIKKESKQENISKSEPADSKHYQISVYDNSEFADRIARHKESLKQLSEKNVFLEINNKQIQKLDEKQQSFFKTNSNYELLALAKGSLFGENDNDIVFIVYDKNNVKISILIYNGATSKYGQLFKDIKVENGFEGGDSKSYSFGTIDYQFADEFLVYFENELTKSIENYLASSTVKITDISKDEDFVIEEGSFAKNTSKTNLAHTLCIATSGVYNNWDCLKYNKTNNTFLLFYSQAFAD